MDIAEGIKNLPSLIWNYLKDGFNDVKNAVLGLPTKILDGIKSIFIPDTAYIENAMTAFLRELEMKFNFDTDFFKGLFTGEQPVKDVNTDYYLPGVGTLNLKIFDTKYLIDGVTFFRPFIRGFLVLLMALYNIKQVLGFIRQDAGIVTGKAVDIEMKARKD